MSDVMIATTWLAILTAGIGAALVLRAFGVASTYIRDFLHVGAGIWVLGWPWWHGPAIPIAIVTVAACGIVAVPTLAKRVRVAERFRRSVTNRDERWGGLVLYTIAYAIFTTIGLVIDPFAAAAALLALSFGDGIGGAVGRALGEHHYRAPGGKQKSLEGSCVVAIAATCGALLAAWLFGVALPFSTAVVLGIVAAIVEAASPRGTDNLLIPATVFVAARLLT
jgi:dolichol kinase